jgi:hypothetical protein
VEVFDPASTRVSNLIWVSSYIKSGRTDRGNIFPSRIQGNVCLSLSDGFFPRIYLHGNICLSLVPRIHGKVFAVTGWFPRIHLHGNMFAYSFRSSGLHVTIHHKKQILVSLANPGLLKSCFCLYYKHHFRIYFYNHRLKDWYRK